MSALVDLYGPACRDVDAIEVARRSTVAFRRCPATLTSRAFAVADLMALRGPLDVLMTAAGISCGGTVVITDPADGDSFSRPPPPMSAAYTPAVSRGRRSRNGQRQGSGSIITLSSQLGDVRRRNNLAYIAAKGANRQPDPHHALDFADGRPSAQRIIAPVAIDKRDAPR